MTGPPAIDWDGDDALRVGRTRFRLVMGGMSTPDDFVLAKVPELGRAFVDLLARHRGADIVELGIFQGGSTALTWLATQPRRLLAVDIDPVPAALVALLDELGQPEGFHVHGGVDQADRTTLATLADQVFGDDPIDLVLDDASHLGGPTRASFEVLFPRLRPGGRYIIEDWGWEAALWSWIDQAIVARDLDALRTNLVSRLEAADPWWPAVSRWVTAVLADRSHPQYTLASNALEAVGVDVPALVDAARPQPDDELVLLTLPGTLAAVQARHPDLIRRVEIDRHWIMVTRGSQPFPRHRENGMSLETLASYATSGRGTTRRTSV